MGQSDQLSQIGSCQIILIMTLWISQASQIKLDHVKSYWLWHDESASQFESICIISNNID